MMGSMNKLIFKIKMRNIMKKKHQQNKINQVKKQRNLLIKLNLKRLKKHKRHRRVKRRRTRSKKVKNLDLGAVSTYVNIWPDIAS